MWRKEVLVFVIVSLVAWLLAGMAKFGLTTLGALAITEQYLAGHQALLLEQLEVLVKSQKGIEFLLIMHGI